MATLTHYWRVRTRLPERHGQPCRVLARGRLNTIMVEFADGLRVTATAADGLVEAVELDGAPVLAVQWELQEDWRVDPRFLRVFEWFVRSEVIG